jgi:hypothetical protein
VGSRTTCGPHPQHRSYNVGTHVAPLQRKSNALSPLPPNASQSAAVPRPPAALAPSRHPRTAPCHSILPPGRAPLAGAHRSCMHGLFEGCGVSDAPHSGCRAWWGIARCPKSGRSGGGCIC